MKDEYIFFEKILREKYPSYYERKYSNAEHRYDNKFYWVYEKNYVNNKFTQQIDFGELFNKEKVKFEDVFEEMKGQQNIFIISIFISDINFFLPITSN